MRMLLDFTIIIARHHIGGIKVMETPETRVALIENGGVIPSKNINYKNPKHLHNEQRI